MADISMDEFKVVKHIVNGIRNGQREHRTSNSKAKKYTPFDSSTPVMELPPGYIRDCWLGYLKQVWSSIPGMDKYGDLSFQITDIVPASPSVSTLTEYEVKSSTFKWIVEIVAETIYRCVWNGKSAIMMDESKIPSFIDANLYMTFTDGKGHTSCVINSSIRCS